MRLSKEGKMKNRPVESERREWEWERAMTQFCFTENWCQRQKVRGGRRCTWWVWAGPRSTREMHNVSFVLSDCTAGTGPSLFLLQSVVSREMWKWFLLLDGSQILLGGTVFTHWSFRPSLSLLCHLPILHLIRSCEFVLSVGSCKVRRCETQECCYESGRSDGCKSVVRPREFGLNQVERNLSGNTFVTILSSCVS